MEQEFKDTNKSLKRELKQRSAFLYEKSGKGNYIEHLKV